MSKINKAHENELITAMNAKCFIAKIFAQPQTFFRMVFCRKCLIVIFFVSQGGAAFANNSAPIACLNTIFKNEDSLREAAIYRVIKSKAFLNFSSRYPKSARFAFPKEMINIHARNKCFVEVTVYLDEDDHYTLIAGFLIKESGVVVKQHKVNQL